MRSLLFARLACLTAMSVAFVSVASADAIWTFEYHFSGTADSLLDEYGFAADPSEWPEGITPNVPFEGGLTLNVTMEECDGEMYFGDHEVTSFWITAGTNQYIVSVGSGDTIWGSYNMANYSLYEGELSQDVFIEASVYGAYNFDRLSFCYYSWDPQSTWMSLYWGDSYYMNVDYVVLSAESYDGSPIDVTSRVVPEPATLTLLAMGGLAMIRRRKA